MRGRGRAAAILPALAALAVVSGCAVRLAGPRPTTVRVVAWTVDATFPPTPAELRQLDADYVVVWAPAARAEGPFASFAARVAGDLDLGVARPTDVGAGWVALLGRDLLGDTAVALPAGSPAPLVRVGDALFRLTGRAVVDVVAVPVATEPGGQTRETARAVLSYVAAEVSSDALTVLALLATGAGDPRGADDFAAAVRPALAGVAECEDATEATAATSVVLLFAPRARLSCRSARVLHGGSVLILELATRA